MGAFSVDIFLQFFFFFPLFGIPFTSYKKNPFQPKIIYLFKRSPFLK